MLREPISTPSPNRRRAGRRCRGFSLLEFEVALVIFGMALAGLGPLVVMQSRQLRRLENRFDDQATYYLLPSDSLWARKLGAAASIRTEDPGEPTPEVTLIDNGQPGYSETDPNTADWESTYPAAAFGGHLRKNDGDAAGDKAAWRFTQLTPGWYEVLVTWTDEDDQATDAPYTVYDGATALGTVRVDQTVKPSGTTFEGSLWESLGAFSITGDTLLVELGDDAGGKVAADAARIVPAGNEVEILSLEKSLIGEPMTAHVSVTVLVP